MIEEFFTGIQTSEAVVFPATSHRGVGAATGSTNWTVAVSPQVTAFPACSSTWYCLPLVSAVIVCDMVLPLGAGANSVQPPQLPPVVM